MNTMSLIKPRTVSDNELYLFTSAFCKSGIDGNDIKNAFIEKNSVASFDRYPADLLIDYIIKRHHIFAKKNTAVIYNLLQKVTYRHNELKKFSEVAFFFFHDLLNQMAKEEKEFFPSIIQTAKEIEKDAEKNNSVLKSLTEKIKWEHTKSFRYLNDFKEMTNNYQTPSHACLYYISLFEKMQELEHDLKLHFQLEDDILFDKIIYH